MHIGLHMDYAIRINDLCPLHLPLPSTCIHQRLLWFSGTRVTKFPDQTRSTGVGAHRDRAGSALERGTADATVYGVS